MDIRVAGDALARELAYFDKIVARKPTIPVLGNVLFDATPGGLVLSATDLDLALSGPCAAQIATPGRMTLPANKLFEIVRSMPGEEIRIFAAASSTGIPQARVEGATYKSRLAALPPDDFPTLPAVTTQMDQIPRAALKRLIGQVQGTSAVSDTRYFLAGALLERDGEAVTMVATDSYRLARAVAAAPVPKADPIIIPTKALNELAVLIDEDVDDKAATVGFAVGERHLFFAVDGRVLVSRTVDGKFPAWQRIFPRELVHTAGLDRQALATVIRRVGLMSSERGRTMTLSLSAGSLRISANSAELGDADDTVRAEYAGPGIECRLQGQYVLDFLSAARGQRITFSLKDSKSQVLFTDGEPGYDVVVVPINL